jgi:hypothetical protein
MDTTDLVNAHTAGSDGDKALYEGKWEIALDKYNLAITLFKKALPLADNNTQPTIEKLMKRYSEKAQQIKDYIESTKSILLSDGEDSENEINEQTLEPLQELDITDESPQNTGLWNIWQNFEKLIGLLPSSGHHLVRPKSIIKKSDGDLSDSSFVVVSDSEDCKNNNIEELKAEIEALKETNAALNMKYQNLVKQHYIPTVVEDLLQENVMLKKSISTFRYQFQKHTESMRASMINPGLSPIPQAKMLSPMRKPGGLQVPDDTSPHEVIRQLKAKLETKDKEIEELKKYKKRYEKIMNRAKKKKESSMVDSSTSSDNIPQ